MPGNGHAVVELLVVLRMDLAAVLDHLLYPLLRRHRGEFHGAEAPDICAQQYPLARALKSGVRISDVHDRQVGVSNAAKNLLVLFPESSLELQPSLDGG